MTAVATAALIVSNLNVKISDASVKCCEIPRAPEPNTTLSATVWQIMNRMNLMRRCRCTLGQIYESGGVRDMVGGR